MSLFVLASKDGWVNIMYHGLDAVGIDQQVAHVSQGIENVATIAAVKNRLQRLTNQADGCTYIFSPLYNHFSPLFGGRSGIQRIDNQDVSFVGLGGKFLNYFIE